jgi:hypothetical protein
MPAPDQLPHLIVEGRFSTEKYTYAGTVPMGEVQLPVRDRLSHGNLLRQQLDQAREQNERVIPSNLRGAAANGLLRLTWLLADTFVLMLLGHRDFRSDGIYELAQDAPAVRLCWTERERRRQQPGPKENAQRWSANGMLKRLRHRETI